MFDSIPNKLVVWESIEKLSHECDSARAQLAFCIAIYFSTLTTTFEIIGEKPFLIKDYCISNID